jgi:dihydrolipoamide dehydrogenase
MIFDLIVLGGGPAGYTAASRAGKAGLNTLLIEKKRLGGVCLNEGCIPSKVLLYSAKIRDSVKSGEKYGVLCKGVALDHGIVLERKNRVIKTLLSGVRTMLAKSSVTVVEGFGRIEGKSGEGYVVKVGGETFTGKRLLIATGSEPVILPVSGIREGIERGYVLTTSEIFELKAVPQSLAVIGAGAVGLEMASYFSSAGSRVTVVEMLDRIAAGADGEISNILLKNYRGKGVDFRLGSRVMRVENGGMYLASEGRESFVEAEKILLSTGRRPVVEGLGLENIGVEVEKGRIRVDETGQTNVPGVYAAGDVNGISMLAHTAYREAEVCVNNMLGRKDIMRYNAIPSVIYTNPEVASVGETEESARHKGIDCEVVKVSMRYSGRYVAENEEGDGICKVLIDKKFENIIGVHMIGNYSSEIIYGAALMVEMQMRVKNIRELVFPHPTVSEIIRESVFGFDSSDPAVR